ncbi:MAG: hypothetical protein ABIJ57_05150 [Pseudomonadota bacterium]
MEIEILRNQAQGLSVALQSLREKERLFIRGNTLSEQVEKARVASDKINEEIEAEKTKMDALKEERARILRESCAAIEKRITDFLPRGQAVLALDEKLFIGWQDGQRVIPYAGLSGGEKSIFDAALCRAFLGDSGTPIVVIEAGEVDAKNLEALAQMVAAKTPGAQVIVNLWHPLEGTLPEGWRVETLGEVKDA